MSSADASGPSLSAVGPNVPSPDGLHILRGVHSLTVEDVPHVDKLSVSLFSLLTTEHVWTMTGSFAHSYIHEERAALANDEDTGYGVAWAPSGSAVYVATLCPELLYKLDPLQGLTVINITRITRNNGIIDAHSLSLNETGEYIVLSILKSNTLLVFNSNSLCLEATLNYPEDCTFEGRVHGVALLAYEWTAFEARQHSLGGCIRRRAPLGRAGYKLKHETQPARRVAKLCDFGNGLTLYRQLFVRLQNPIELLWYDMKKQQCGVVCFDEDPRENDVRFVSYRVRSNLSAWDGRWLILEARDHHLMIVDTKALGDIARREILCQESFERAVTIARFDGRFASFCPVRAGHSDHSLRHTESPRIVLSQVAFGFSRRSFRSHDDWFMRVEGNQLVPEYCLVDMDVPQSPQNIVRCFDHLETRGMLNVRIKSGVLKRLPTAVCFLPRHECILNYWLSCLDRFITKLERIQPTPLPNKSPALQAIVPAGGKPVQNGDVSWLAVLVERAPDTLETITNNLSVINRTRLILAYPRMAQFFVPDAEERHALLVSLIFRQEAVSRVDGHDEHWLQSADTTATRNPESSASRILCRPKEDLALEYFFALCAGGDHDLMAMAVSAYRNDFWGASARMFVESENRLAADALATRLDRF